MDRHEMNTIGAEFARRLWQNPRNGETRLYINGLPCGVKCWAVADAEGRPEVHWRSDFSRFGMEDAYAALDRAMQHAGLSGDMTFNDITAAVAA